MSGETRILGSLLGADFNTTSDQSIAIDSARYVITEIVFSNFPNPLSGACRFQIYTGAAQSGTQVAAFGGSTGVGPMANVKATWFVQPTPGVARSAPGAQTNGLVLDAATLFFSLQAAHGAGIVGDITVRGFDLP